MTARLPIDTDRRTAIGSVDTSDLIPGFDERRGRVMKEAYKLKTVDPVTGELVRFRNARIQDCVVCQQFRDPLAQRWGATEGTLAAVDDYESSDLPEQQKVALRLVDAYLTSPGKLSPELVADLRAHFEPTQVVELLLRLAGTTGNRILRVFDFDR